MLRFHQIPCSCGKVHEVSKTQAGSSLTCDCGQEVSVPTLRELKDFPVVERPDPQTAELTLASASGARERRTGLIFVLFVAAVLFAGLGIYYHQTCPKVPTVENAETPFEVWQVWQTLRTGIDTPPSRGEMIRTDTIRMHWRWIVICGGASGLCVLGMLAGVLVRGGGRRTEEAGTLK